MIQCSVFSDIMFYILLYHVLFFDITFCVLQYDIVLCQGQTTQYQLDNIPNAKTYGVAWAWKPSMSIIVRKSVVLFCAVCHNG